MLARATRGLAYTVLALVAIGPGMWRAGGIPGSAHADTWESLWTLWHGIGTQPGRTAWLDAPQGGAFWVADPLNAVLMWPLVLLLGVVFAWCVAVVGHLVFAGIAADALAVDLGADHEGALVAGAAFCTAPTMLSSIHNGTSEGFAWGWLPLALLVVRRALLGSGWTMPALSVLALALAGVASAYLAVGTWVAVLVLIVATPGRRALLLGALGAATVLVLPWYALESNVVSAPDNIVGIKDARELALLRRTIGPVDPLALFLPGDYRSPDFREISRYGEDFLHCTYLGWTWLIAAVAAGWRARGLGWAALAGAILIVASFGPVLVHDGTAVLLPGDLGVPLPYFLVERLPGMASLSLLWRLCAVPCLALALLASRALGGWRATLLAGCGVAEILVASPLRGGPAGAALPDTTALESIAGTDEGAVMNWPVVGGRPYLYEATVHGHPVAGRLNFPLNDASEAVWKALGSGRATSADVAAVAEHHGVRYVVLHEDAAVGLDPYGNAVQRLRASGPPLAESGGITVYALW